MRSVLLLLEPLIEFQNFIDGFFESIDAFVWQLDFIFKFYCMKKLVEEGLHRLGLTHTRHDSYLAKLESAFASRSFTVESFDPDNFIRDSGGNPYLVWNLHAKTFSEGLYVNSRNFNKWESTGRQVRDKQGAKK